MHLCRFDIPIGSFYLCYLWACNWMSNSIAIMDIILLRSISPSTFRPLSYWWQVTIRSHRKCHSVSCHTPMPHSTRRRFWNWMPIGNWIMMMRYRVLESSLGRNSVPAALLNCHHWNLLPPFMHTSNMCPSERLYITVLLIRSVFLKNQIKWLMWLLIQWKKWSKGDQHECTIAVPVSQILWPEFSSPSYQSQ